MSDQTDADIVDVVLEALEHAVEKLSRLGGSAQVVSLQRQAISCRRQVMEWRMTLPPLDEREAVMRAVLALHVAIERKGRS